jgi:hypothetical protein
MCSALLAFDVTCEGAATVGRVEQKVAQPRPFSCERLPGPCLWVFPLESGQLLASEAPSSASLAGCLTVLREQRALSAFKLLSFSGSIKLLFSHCLPPA